MEFQVGQPSLKVAIIRSPSTPPRTPALVASELGGLFLFILHKRSNILQGTVQKPNLSKHYYSCQRDSFLLLSRVHGNHTHSAASTAVRSSNPLRLASCSNLATAAWIKSWRCIWRRQFQLSFSQATRCRIISVSVLDWYIDPFRTGNLLEYTSVTGIST